MGALSFSFFPASPQHKEASTEKRVPIIFSIIHLTSFTLPSHIQVVQIVDNAMHYVVMNYSFWTPTCILTMIASYKIWFVPIIFHCFNNTIVPKNAELLFTLDFWSLPLSAKVQETQLRHIA